MALMVVGRTWSACEEASADWRRWDLCSSSVFIIIIFMNIYIYVCAGVSYGPCWIYGFWCSSANLHACPEDVQYWLYKNGARLMAYWDDGNLLSHRADLGWRCFCMRLAQHERGVSPRSYMYSMRLANSSTRRTATVKFYLYNKKGVVQRPCPLWILP